MGLGYAVSDKVGSICSPARARARLDPLEAIERMKPKIVLSAASWTDVRADVLSVLVARDQLDQDARISQLDDRLRGQLRRLAARSEFAARSEQIFELFPLADLGVPRLTLVGIGESASFDEARLRSCVAATVRQAASVGAVHLALLLPERSTKEASGFREVAEGIVLGAYRFDKYLTGDRRPKRKLEQVTVLTRPRPATASRRAIDLGARIGEAVCLARDAVNEPPNELPPSGLVEIAQQVSRRGHLRIKVLDAQAIDRAGMKLLAAVGRGSSHGPRFIHLTYLPKQRKRKRLVLLGKGLTFDSGGLCIKPAAGMGEMKSDMGGAAAVLGTMDAVAALHPAVEVHGLVVAAENMPDGNAYRPGDVFGSLDGKTVEIINTDAEGRLALADGISYARRLKPDLLIDAATLTGACVVALGKTTSGFFATHDDLATRFDRAAKVAGEGFWRMPLLSELREQLKSDVADIKHTGERWGGSITAALFLREFVQDVPWIHCDIAGPVLSDRAHGVVPKGATGHAVMTFTKFIEEFG